MAKRKSKGTRQTVRIVMAQGKRGKGRARRTFAKLKGRFKARKTLRRVTIPVLSLAVGAWLVAMLLQKLAESQFWIKLQTAWVQAVRQAGEQRDLAGAAISVGQAFQGLAGALFAILPFALVAGLGLGAARTFLKRWNTSIRFGPIVFRPLS